jgi:hypothetical protein
MDVSSLTDQALNITLKNCVNKVNLYTGVLNISHEEVAELTADSQAFDYALNMQDGVQKNSKDWTAFKGILRSSKSFAVMDFPTWTPAAPPAPTRGGINSKFSKFVQRLKNHEKFTEAIGHDLGIMSIGEKMSPAALATMKPILKVHLVAGQPIVEWKKGDADGIEIHKAEGTAIEFSFIAFDLHPHFPDKTPLPAGKQSVVWKYKAIYLKDDARVGEWSDEVSISVMG